MPEGLKLTLFVPAEGETGLEVKFQLGPLSFPLSLTRLPQRDEGQASPNVSLVWHQPGERLHTDIWATGNLVFAPRLDGFIEILDAKSGRVLGTAIVAGSAGEDRHIVLDVKVHDGLLYAATVSNGLVVFDVSEPTSPKLIGQYHRFVQKGSPENFTNIHNIFLSPDGRLVYAINHSLIEESSRPPI